MADETPAAQAPAATPAPPAEAAPVKVDARAAALRVLNGEAPEGTTPKEPATGSPASATTKDASAAAADPKDQAAAPKDADEPGDKLKRQAEELRKGFGKLAVEKAGVLEKEKALKGAAADGKIFRETQAKAKQDPAILLDVYGITFEQFAEAYLRRTNPEALKEMGPTAEERLAAIEKERADERKAAADKADEDARKSDAQRMDQAQQGAFKAIESQMLSQADKYPVITSKGEYAEVYTAISEYVTRHSMPINQVTPEFIHMIAAAYEEARQEQIDQEISPLIGKVPRLAARLAPATQTPPSGQPYTSGAQGTSSANLANSAVSEAPPPQGTNGRMTREQLTKAALEVLNRA